MHIIQVHIIVGIGNFEAVGNLSSTMRGVMADVAASPNDPIFINHHSMVDCVLEEWLQRNPDAQYPDVPSEIKGHQRDAYIVPFFPLYKHSDFFNTAENFGYSCGLSNVTVPRSAATSAPKPLHWVVWIGALGGLISLRSI